MEQFFLKNGISFKKRSFIF